ncbi:PLP-dependent transferase [Cubamyces sp. BRFM 1775]|nr:PLP-dependent transferase [Cubamyces sp. BRFM 1775]
MVQSLPSEFYSDFLSATAKARKPSPIRGLYPLEARPGMISLLAGKPNSATFPLTSVQIKARSPTNPEQELTTEIAGKALAEGLQYGPTAGLPNLCEWIFGLQEREHGRKKGEGWRVSIGSGSQDVIHKAILALVNPGEPVLVESPVYAGILPTFESLNCEFVVVPTDSQGIQSSNLRSTLENWPASKPKPKVLYTVPYGGNPTGMTASKERRQEVLALAREHNFLILEDDPYYYLYFGSAPRPPSYFTLELEQPEVGRVIRFDSLSKILSSGIRIGFACGPEAIMTAIDMHVSVCDFHRSTHRNARLTPSQTAVANLQTSSLTQAITFALLDSWGYDNFKAHTHAVSQFYKGKRDVFERLMKKHLDGLAQWDTPEAGMFFWFKLLLKSPGAEGAEEEDSESLIRTKALEKGVLALPGTVFLPDGGKTAYVRAAFSLLDEADVEEAIKRLREVVLEARGA